MARYEVKRSPYSSHSQIKRILGRGHGRRLLDVGCADGEFSLQLAEQGWQVTGIEPFEADAAMATSRGIAVVRGTVEDSLPRLEETFDAVLLGDVLEHLADPWKQLQRVSHVCTPNTDVVVSIPNVAHLSVRAQIARGRFIYTEKGILDRTHLRFFTRDSAIELIEQSGFRIREMWFTPAPIELVLPRLSTSQWGRLLLGFNAMLARSRPGLFAYQFLALCSLADPVEHL